jgi:hypothetical protein
VAAHEARPGEEASDRAPAVLDDDSDAGVVEDQIAEEQERAEDSVAGEADERPSSTVTLRVNKP